MAYENETVVDQKALLALNEATFLRVFGPWMAFFEVLAMTFFLLFSGTDDNYFYLMLGFVLFIPILLGLAFFSTRARIRKDAPGSLDRTVVRFRFGDDSVRAEEISPEGSFSEEADYVRLWKIVESPDYWFLYFQKAPAMVVAKNGFSNPPEDFPGYLRERRIARKKFLRDSRRK